MEEYSAEQVRYIINEEFNEDERSKSNIKLTKEEINEMIEKVEKFDINEIENDSDDEDIEMTDNDKIDPNQNSNKSKKAKDPNDLPVEVNLNDKYGSFLEKLIFQIWNLLEKKKIIL